MRNNHSTSHFSVLTLCIIAIFCFGFTNDTQAQKNPEKQAIRAAKKEAKRAKRAAREEVRRLKELSWIEGESDISEIELKSESNTNPIASAPELNEAKMDVESTSENSINQLEEYAMSLRGIPYRYGGQDKTGFDCSGFSSHVLARSGLLIPRTAQAQFNACRPISNQKSQKGDLVFFGKGKKKINHVGIIVSQPGEDLSMIHASSSKGIIVTNIEKSQYWKARFVSIGRPKQQ